MLRHLPTFLILLLFYPISSVYAQDILWQRSLGGKQAEQLKTLLATPDGGFILAGSSLSAKTGNKSEAGNGDMDYYLYKMDANGNPEWQRSYGGSGTDELSILLPQRDGGYLLGGSSNSTPGGDQDAPQVGESDYWALKIDPRGEVEWQKRYGGTGPDQLQSLSETPGGYLLAGTTESPAGADKKEAGQGAKDLWLIQTDAVGNIRWQHTYGGSYNDELVSSLSTQDGGYLIAATSNSPASSNRNPGSKTEANQGQSDYWLIKLNAQGQEQWQRSYGGMGDDRLSAVIHTQDGGYLLGGSSNSNASGNKTANNKNGTDYWLIKTDANGAILWQQTYDYGKEDLLVSLLEDPATHSYFIAGYNKVDLPPNNKPGSTETGNDYQALKINDKGEVQWQKTIGGSGVDILSNVIETRDGSYLLAGTSDSPPGEDKNSAQGSTDYWMLKLKDNGKPHSYSTAKQVEVYPNPTDGISNVVFASPYQSGQAQLWDMTGRLLLDQKIKFQIEPIDLSTYPPGVYLLKVTTDQLEQSLEILKTGSAD